MNKTWLIIALLAITITALSNTVSLISGEHGFYSNETMKDKCLKCHGDIKTQLSSSVYHSTLTCIDCHIMTNHTNSYTLDCNTNNNNCHSNPNLMPQLTNQNESHIDFADPTKFNGSEGCIACHTTYNVIVNFSRPAYIEYDIVNDSGDWNITLTNIGEMINIPNSRSGNTTPNPQNGNHNFQNVSCQDCHRDIFNEINNNNINAHGVINNTSYHSITNSSPPLEAWCRTCHNTNNDSANFSTQHAARIITCEECHLADDPNIHPGNFYANIQTFPRLYRGLVCVSCHNADAVPLNPTSKIHFKVSNNSLTATFS